MPQRDSEERIAKARRKQFNMRPSISELSNLTKCIRYSVLGSKENSNLFFLTSKTGGFYNMMGKFNKQEGKQEFWDSFWMRTFNVIVKKQRSINITSKKPWRGELLCRSGCKEVPRQKKRSTGFLCGKTVCVHLHMLSVPTYKPYIILSLLAY